MTKSEAAFRMSAEKLFAESRRVYFWTITFREVHHDWQYAGLWNRFWRDFVDRTNFFLSGIRVLEFHENHGIHFHLLCNRRLPVGLVRRFGIRWGIGRVHVQIADKGAIGYLTKYLSKDTTKIFTRLNKWNCFGGFDGVKVRDIDVDSEFGRQFAKARGGRQVGYRGYLLARRQYIRNGRVGEIPESVREVVRKPSVDKLIIQLRKRYLRSIPGPECPF